LFGDPVDLIEHNRRSWDRLAREGILWSKPVSSGVISDARRGEWSVSLAGHEVSRQWLGTVADRDILCLASAGGQQAPVLAAAGANVTSLDLSEEQLERDRLVAEREGLCIRLEQGTMTDLSRFSDFSFDLVFLPVAVNAIPEVDPLWRECHRVLRAGGELLAGFINPIVYLFEENDGADPNAGLEVVHSLPYSEFEACSEEHRQDNFARKSLFLWSHSLELLIGGQLNAGFVLIGFQEGRRSDERAPSINRYTSTYFSTRARKGAAAKASEA
jgi:2-polyprenyl-3-methyl-5-hydroxy-6-metoxy-1,4-benzoquinol methylase